MLNKIDLISRVLNKTQIKVAAVTGVAIFTKPIAVYATDYESSLWKLIGIAREGLFWVCMFVSFYGLYMTLFKKDDTGKKIMAGAFLVYLGAWLIPEGYIFVRDIFSN